ncbi:hypothetical protein BACCAP_04781 [Pseudoflavonifractor capillosus ATCC 29799]|uniref:Uncharacterized protein n=1 Tax=Pseudoflavonifractor capillosus ATCC 29799 TaxID=411467 RepID=A6P2P9_9FIRM|nr:hypothetical protein BACCAP_04781 [Pseudoflavonifractor capillosus ATCC 29799]
MDFFPFRLFYRFKGAKSRGGLSIRHVFSPSRRRHRKTQQAACRRSCPDR